MSFFNSEVPLILRKRSAFAVGEMPGLWRVHWQVGNVTLFSSFYTRHDQACLLWGVVSAAIFLTAQFMPVSWVSQAVFSSIFTGIGVLGMAGLTWHFARVERLNWVLSCWIGLMLIGIVLTNLGIFAGWLPILTHICPLWLALSGIGDIVTGIGMRSRTFILFGLLHLLTIAILPYVGIWQPLTTGIVISGCAFLMAELQWDANGVCGYQDQRSDKLVLESL